MRRISGKSRFGVGMRIEITLNVAMHIDQIYDSNLQMYTQSDCSAREGRG